jgi:hypothetical protein
MSGGVARSVVHTFSAFWLRSSVVSVPISLISDMLDTVKLEIKLISCWWPGSPQACLSPCAMSCPAIALPAGAARPLGNFQLLFANCKELSYDLYVLQTPPFRFPVFTQQAARPCVLHGRLNGGRSWQHGVTYLAGPTRDHEGEWTIRSAPLAPRRSTGWCWLPWGVNTQHNFWQRWEDALARRPAIPPLINSDRNHMLLVFLP